MESGCAVIRNKNELLEKHREGNTVLKMLQLKSVEWNRNDDWNMLKRKEDKNG